MGTVQVRDLCHTCRNYYQGDAECSCGIFIEYDKYVIECDDYEEGEPMLSYFDELEKQQEGGDEHGEYNT